MKDQSNFTLEVTRWQKEGRILALLLFIVVGEVGFVRAQQTPLDAQLVAEVEACIRGFATAGDKRDIKALEDLLHPSYRTVLNKAFGSDEVSLMSKEDYIGMAKAGKIGGTGRSLHILSLEIQPEIAHATVLLESAEMRFTSFYSLVRNAHGKWQMIGDMPRVEKL